MAKGHARIKPITIAVMSANQSFHSASRWMKGMAWLSSMKPPKAASSDHVRIGRTRKEGDREECRHMIELVPPGEVHRLVRRQDRLDISEQKCAPEGDHEQAAQR